MSNKIHSHVYAIIRVDNWPDISMEPNNAITVKKVVKTQELAISEVKRLNELNKDKGSVYFWQTTRFENE